MRKFLLKLALFSTLALLLLATIEVALLFIPNTYSYKRVYLEKHINDINILLMGSSYIEEGVRPEIIGDGCFNIAISGRDIVFDAEIAKKYFSKMNQLKIVLLPLDYSKFEFGRGHKNPLDTRIELDRMTVTYRCMHYKYMNLYVDDFWYWSEILNSQLNYVSRFWQSRQENVECDSLGYHALVLKNRQEGWEYRAVPPIIDTSKKIDNDSFNRYWPYMEVIADCAKEKGAKMVLVNIPKYTTYQNDINNNVVQEINQLITQLQSKFNNVVYWDFTYNEEFGDDDFFDACHLSDDGAKKFSRMLGEKIRDL